VVVFACDAMVTHAFKAQRALRIACVAKTAMV